MTHDRVRAVVSENGISRAELSAEMRSQGLCKGREDEMIDRLLTGGPCVLGVGVAVFSIVGRQMMAAAH